MAFRISKKPPSVLLILIAHRSYRPVQCKECHRLDHLICPGSETGMKQWTAVNFWSYRRAQLVGRIAPRNRKGAERRCSRDSIPTLHRGARKLKFRPSDLALQPENFLAFPQVNPDSASEAYDHLLAHLFKLLLLIILLIILPFCRQPE